MKHKLNAPRMLDPFWFNKMKTGEQEGIALDAETIEVHGEQMRLAHPDEIRLDAGEKVFVSLGLDFCLERESERTERLTQNRSRYEEDQARQRERLAQLRAEAQEFNASLRIPVKWEPGIKDVLSGLSENSWGDGRNRATVEHILLRGDLVDGQLRRRAGDFLCTAPRGTNGKQWSAQPESTYQTGGQEYRPKVTCRACLKIAERWREHE